MNLKQRTDKLRSQAATGGPPSYDERRKRLVALRDALQKHEGAILDALHSDLGKSPQESIASEMSPVLSDIDHALRNLRRWMRPRRVRPPLISWPASARIEYAPAGTVLIIGPWNYPFQLLLSPLVAALAAGNTVCLKPSEVTPASEKAIARLISEAFDEEVATVVTGGPETTTELLTCAFDHVFFTGSTRVGRIVMQAAASMLTPVTLELGGKCPCVVFADADPVIAARRIIWGKLLNAGQTCVAPDFVAVERPLYDTLCATFESVIREFLGNKPQDSSDYGRIVNTQHLDRLLSLLDGAKIRYGGESDRATHYLAPTLVESPEWETPLMQEEIFGPILPVLPFDDLGALIAQLKQLPSPLALYAFGRNKANWRKLVDAVPAGGVCINGTVHHIIGKTLPFGGVGESGMGRYHGEAGFVTFSRQRSLLHRAEHPDPGFVYPPITTPLKWLRRATRFTLR